MTLETLYALGAPKLPDGMFYRVSSSDLGIVEVQIRETRKRYGSRQISVCTGFPTEGDSPEETVRWIAQRAYDKRQERIERTDFWSRFSTLEGDHH